MAVISSPYSALYNTLSLAARYIFDRQILWLRHVLIRSIFPTHWIARYYELTDENVD